MYRTWSTLAARPRHDVPSRRSTFVVAVNAACLLLAGSRMRTLSPFVYALPLLAVLACTGDEPDGDTPALSSAAATPDAPTSGRITVQVIDVNGGATGTLSGLPVVFNDGAGNVLGASGATDASGRLSRDGIPAGASASVLLPLGENQNILQTVYSLQPGQTVLVSNLGGAAGAVLTLDVHLANLPSIPASSTIQVSVGDCRKEVSGSGPFTVTIPVVPSCRQSDGLFTVYATIGSGQTLLATALVEDLAVPKTGSSLDVTLGTWRLESGSSVDLTFFGAPAPFLLDDGRVGPTGTLSLERKGARYPSFVADSGTLGDTDLVAMRALFPADLPIAAGGGGFRLEFAAEVLAPTGRNSIRVSERRQFIESVASYDLGPFTKEASDFTAATDLTTPTRPKLTWNTRAGSSLNTVVAIAEWSDPAVAGSAFEWVATAPYTLKTVQLPKLPAGFPRFGFPTTGEVTAPTVIAVDASWHATYADFITHESPFVVVVSDMLKGAHLRTLSRDATISAPTVKPASRPAPLHLF